MDKALVDMTRMLMDATVVLAVVTFLLVVIGVVHAIHLNNLADETKKIAKAAQDSADAAKESAVAANLSAETADATLKLSHVPLIHFIEAVVWWDDLTQRVMYRAAFANYGTSNPRFYKCMVQTICASNLTPDDTRCEPMMATNAADSFSERLFAAGVVTFHNEGMPSMGGTQELRFYGHIAYFDEFGQEGAAPFGFAVSGIPVVPTIPMQMFPVLDKKYAASLPQGTRA